MLFIQGSSLLRGVVSAVAVPSLVHTVDRIAIQQMIWQAAWVLSLGGTKISPNARQRAGMFAGIHASFCKARQPTKAVADSGHVSFVQ